MKRRKTRKSRKSRKGRLQSGCRVFSRPSRVSSFHYRALFEEAEGDLTLPFDPAESTAAHLCPALLPAGTDRKAVMEQLRAGGVHTSIHYPPIHRFSHHAARLGRYALPHTESFCERELSLPLHAGLATVDVDYAADRLRDAAG